MHLSHHGLYPRLHPQTNSLFCIAGFAGPYTDKEVNLTGVNEAPCGCPTQPPIGTSPLTSDCFIPADRNSDPSEGNKPHAFRMGDSVWRGDTGYQIWSEVGNGELKQDLTQVPLPPRLIPPPPRAFSRTASYSAGGGRRHVGPRQRGLQWRPPLPSPGRRVWPEGGPMADQLETGQHLFPLRSQRRRLLRSVRVEWPGRVWLLRGRPRVVLADRTKPDNVPSTSLQAHASRNRYRASFPTHAPMHPRLPSSTYDLLPGRSKLSGIAAVTCSTRSIGTTSVT